MKLSYQQLAPHLTKNLAPIYLIHGDEILLVQEAVDAIRTAAYSAGFTERVLTTAEGNDWGKLIYSHTHSLSLFADKKIIELDLNHIKLNAANTKFLEEYALHPPQNTLLIINSAKLDAKIEKSAWYQAIDKIGMTLPIWPIQAEQLPQWLMQRAKKFNLNLTKESAERLSSQVEGNLLAAAQELEKLSLLHPGGLIDTNTLDNAITDNARFDIFQLVDNTLLGNRPRSLRILQNLANEDTEPTLVLWALTRELRTLCEMQKKMKQGASLSSLFSQFRIWEKRQPAVRAFLQRHPQRDGWDLLLKAAEIDRMIKGIEIGNTWDTLADLVIKMA